MYKLVRTDDYSFPSPLTYKSMEKLLDRSAVSLDKENKFLGVSSKKVSLMITCVNPVLLASIIVHVFLCEIKIKVMMHVVFLLCSLLWNAYHVNYK